MKSESSISICKLANYFNIFFIQSCHHSSGKHNVNISQKRVASALQVVAPIYHERRQSNTVRMISPIPYRANYFGQKLHINQNKKLVMYRVTHVVAKDGHSRFIPARSTIPVKKSNYLWKDFPVCLSEIDFYLLVRKRFWYSDQT